MWDRYKPTRVPFTANNAMLPTLHVHTLPTGDMLPVVIKTASSFSMAHRSAPTLGPYGISIR